MAADVTVSPTLGHAVLMTQGGVGASPGYDAIDLRRMVQAASGGQEGVYDSTGWKVREHTSGANMQVQIDANVGVARVNGESVTHQGPYVVAPHSAVITLDVTAAHSTNPRIDMVILQIRDHTHDASGQNDARVRILAGTATSGATLDNLNGQQSLPSNAIRLADVLVPAADTTISNAQIRDRRLWARGFHYQYVRTAGDYSTTSGSIVDIDGTNLTRRCELSGVPLVVTFAPGDISISGGVATITIRLDDNGTTRDHVADPSAAGKFNGWPMIWQYTPAAGSHPMALKWVVGGGFTALLRASSTYPLGYTIREDIRQNASND